MTTILRPPAALLEAKTNLPCKTSKSAGRRENKAVWSCNWIRARINPSRTSVSTVDGDWLLPITAEVERSTAVTLVKVLPKSMRKATELMSNL